MAGEEVSSTRFQGREVLLEERQLRYSTSSSPGRGITSTDGAGDD